MNKLDAALKELKKEQQEWQNKKSDLERDCLHLEAQNKHLKGKNVGLKTQKAALLKEIDTEQLRLEELRHKGSQLLVENDRLESDKGAQKAELQHLDASLDAKKSSMDGELQEYETARKQEIKQSI